MRLAAGRRGPRRKRRLTLTIARCPDCDRELERGDRERYTCGACGRRWLRIGLLFEPEEPEVVAEARVVSEGPGAHGPKAVLSACCYAMFDDAGWEKSACSACGKRYIRVGIALVPE
ncbi:MAG: hypothetical protein ACKV2T_35590 [Kofleriaceae bacterium]